MKAQKNSSNETNVSLRTVAKSNQRKVFLITTLRSIKRLYLFTLVTLFSLLAASCKKENKTTQPKFSQQILNIVPLSTIDSLKKWGMIINEGTTPPNLEGAYLINNIECTFDNSDKPKLGTGWTDYKYRFYNQDNNKLTINVDYKSTSAADTAKGVGSFVSGNGNNFSVFLQTQGTSSGVAYKTIYVISGIKKDNGITSWQHCFQLTEKGNDPNGILIKTGTTRIFKDGDQSSTLTTYAIKPVNITANSTKNAKVKGMLEVK